MASFLKWIFKTPQTGNVPVPESHLDCEQTLIPSEIGQFFTSTTYSQSLTDQIIFFLESADLQRLTSVNRFCKSVCDREFSKIAIKNAYTPNMHLCTSNFVIIFVSTISSIANDNSIVLFRTPDVYILDKSNFKVILHLSATDFVGFVLNLTSAQFSALLTKCADISQPTFS
jgi:hypothetical protein